MHRYLDVQVSKPPGGSGMSFEGESGGDCGGDGIVGRTDLLRFMFKC